MRRPEALPDILTGLGAALAIVVVVVAIGLSSRPDNLKAAETAIEAQRHAIPIEDIEAGMAPLGLAEDPDFMFDPEKDFAGPAANVRSEVQAILDPSGSDSGKGGLLWPVPPTTISGVFGENRGDHIHAGVDLTSPVGTPIKAAAGGKVLFAGPKGGYGNYVCISHRAFTTCYAHLGQVQATVGRSVKRGAVIGQVGMSGNSSGAHLHFEVRKGSSVDGAPLNPGPYKAVGVASVGEDEGGHVLVDRHHQD